LLLASTHHKLEIPDRVPKSYQWWIVSHPFAYDKQEVPPSYSMTAGALHSTVIFQPNELTKNINQPQVKPFPSQHETQVNL
jgi:hypothetical protein